MIKKEIIIHTDGACSGNPGPGGWSATVRVGDHPADILVGGDPHTTNNAMELQAALSALRHVFRMSEADKARITLRADSEYVLKGLSEWLPSWKRNGWRGASGKPVKNLRLWQDLDAAYQALQAKADAVTLIHVRGHSGDPENELVDQEAVAAREVSREKSVSWSKLRSGTSGVADLFAQLKAEAISSGYVLESERLQASLDGYLFSIQKKIHDGPDILYIVTIDCLSLEDSGQPHDVVGSVKAQFHTGDNQSGLAVNVEFQLSTLEEAEKHLSEIWVRMGYGRYRSYALEPS